MESFLSGTLTGVSVKVQAEKGFNLDLQSRSPFNLSNSRKTLHNSIKRATTNTTLKNTETD